MSSDSCCGSESGKYYTQSQCFPQYFSHLDLFNGAYEDR